jgi:hypothetical protein
MSGHAFILSLESRGAALEVENDKLRVTPAHVLTDTDRAMWREHKTAILKVLGTTPKKRIASTCNANDAPDTTEPTRRAPRWPSAASLRLANEIGGIFQVLAGAKRLKNGDWRINGERYEHDDAVLLAAHTRGTTTNGIMIL